MSGGGVSVRREWKGEIGARSGFVLTKSSRTVPREGSELEVGEERDRD